MNGLATIIWDTQEKWGGRVMYRSNEDLNKFLRGPGSIERYYLVTPWGPICLEQLRQR